MQRCAWCVVLCCVFAVSSCFVSFKLCIVSTFLCVSTRPRLCSCAHIGMCHTCTSQEAGVSLISSILNIQYDPSGLSKLNSTAKQLRVFMPHVNHHVGSIDVDIRLVGVVALQGPHVAVLLDNPNNVNPVTNAKIQ